MKKKFLVGLCLTMATSMALAACGNPAGKTNALSSPNDVYGMGAVSSVRLLGNNMPASAIKTLSAVSATTQTRTCGVKLTSSTADDPEKEVKEQTEKFNEYFTALDSFLGDDVVSTTTQVNTDENYEYDVKMTINGKDFNGKTVTYIMYYTETLVKADSAEEKEETNPVEENEETNPVDENEETGSAEEKEETNPADENEETGSAEENKETNPVEENKETNPADENKEANPADEEETENEYQLVGVMVIDGAEYYLEGERSEETEETESETELRIRAYADKTDKTSYIQMEQEYSVEDGETETEYVYSIYANGELSEQTAVEFETEKKNGKVETEYELEFRSGTSKGKYVVKREVTDDKISIKVKYNIDGKTGVFHIREITDESGNKKYEYSYSDGSKQVFD